MEITDGEKLILLMLTEIYQKLGIDGEIDPEFVQSALFSDNLWGIPWRYSGIPFDDTATPPVVNEVVDILDMWMFIERSYEDLTDGVKARIESDAPFGGDSKFRGFDGNNKSGYVGVARFLIKDLSRFSDFGDRDLDAHMPTIETHKRMLTVFRPIRAGLLGRLMTADELIDVLNEQVHPDSR